MNANPPAGKEPSLAGRSIIAVGMATIVASLALAFYAGFLFEARLAPEIDDKSHAVARSLQADVDRAVSIGIPIERLAGMDEFLSEILDTHRELAAVRVADASGRVLFSRRNAGADVPTREVRQALEASRGQVVVEVRADYARNQLLAGLVDAAIVLFVTLLLAFELLPLVLSRFIGVPLASLSHVLRAAGNGDFTLRVGTRASGRLGALIARCNAGLDALAARGGRTGAGAAYRASSPGDIRVPMFVIVLAEQLCMAFFPLFARELYAPVPGLSMQAAIALPIAFYMLFVALGTLFGGGVISRFRSVRTFRAGVVLAAAGFLGLVFAHNLYDLLLWRTLTAVGYALSTLACQAYVAEVASRENQTRALGVFVGAVMVASLCGASFGGVLADLFGYRGVFAVSFCLVWVSIALFPATSAVVAEPVEAAARTLSLAATYRILASNRGFAAVMLLAAIPAKLMLTGVVFYLTPLFLGHHGHDAATIGRCIMVYYLLMAFATPLSARLADHYGWSRELVIAGGIIAGLGSVAALAVPGLPAAVIAMAALGIGHVLATAPTFTLALSVGEAAVQRVGKPNALAAIRVIERVGSVAGPLAAGTLVAMDGFASAQAILGATTVACALGLAIALRLQARKERP